MNHSSEYLDIFCEEISKTFNCKINKKKLISRNVFEITEQINCLFYIKVRATNSNWGITRNVIERLKAQKLNWFILLISTSEYPNYILTSNDFNYYIKNKLWMLNKDGDYKTTSIIDPKKEFKSYEELKIFVKNNI